MNKRTGLILIISSGLALLAALLIVGLSRAAGAKKTFETGGYVLEVTQGAQNAVVAQRFFTANTSCGAKYPNELRFTDTTGKDVSIASTGFVHYNDGSHAALSDGMLIDLNELSRGFLGYYSISAGTKVNYDGKNYAVCNSAGDILFDTFAWKLSDSKYMLVGSDMTFDLPSGEKTTLEGYAELDYIGNGVARVYNASGVYQVICEGSLIELSNGVKLDVGTGVLSADNGKQIGLQNIEMDTETAVAVVEADIVLPEFDITTIDGKDGVSGETGQDGTDGDEGTEGATGENGTTGNQGSSGSDGAQGAQGEDGISGDQVSTGKAASEPTFRFTEFTPNASGIKFTVEVNDDDSVLVDDPANSAKIYEAGTGRLVWQDLESGNFASGAVSQSFDVSGLAADVQYRVVVTQAYEMENNGVTVSGTKDFLSRLFFTDAVGITMKVAYTTTDTVCVDLVKADYSNAVTVVAELYDATGTTSVSAPITQNFSGSTSNARVMFGSLASDTEYMVKLTKVTLASGEDATSKNTANAITLKREPSELGKPTALVNVKGYFELQLDGNIVDPDNGIVRFRYDIYETDGKLVKTVYSDNKDPVALYIDGENIKRGTYYYQIVTAEFFDNAKTLEFECSAPDENTDCGYETFIMRGDGIPVIYFEQTDTDATTFERIKGSIVVDATDCTAIVDAQHPLTVTVAAVGNYLGTIQIDSVNLIDGVFRIPIDLQGMKKETQYLFTVTGYTDPYHDGVYQKGDWGSFRHSTLATKPINVSLVENAEGTGSINATLTLGIDGETTQSLEATTMTRLVVIMRNAKNTTQVLGSEYVLNDTIAEYYTSQLANDYYGTGLKIELNETSFGLSANSAVLEGVQQVEIVVQAIYDYTASDIGQVSANISGYVNELTFTGDSKVVVTRIPTPPALPSGTSLSVTAIQNLQTQIYLDDASPDAAFDNGTIMGYSLSPNFDNSAGLAQRVYYFVYDAVEYRALLKSLTGEQRKDPSYAPDEITGKIEVNGNTLIEPLYAWGHDLTTAERGKSELPILNVFLGNGILSEPVLQTSTATRENRAVYSVYAGEDAGRGAEYFFTYNVQWYTDTEQTRNYVYPYSHDNYGVLSSDVFAYSNLLQSTGGPDSAGSWKAFRQKASMHIYPYTSDENSITWRYRIDDPDATLAHNFRTSTLNTSYCDIAANVGLLGAKDISVNTAYQDLVLDSITVAGSGSTSVVLKMHTCLMYDTQEEETILSQPFEGRYTIVNAGDSALSISYERKVNTNNYIISVTGLKKDLDRVATIAIRFREQGETGEFTQPLFISVDSVNEVENSLGQGLLTATLPLSKLDDNILASVAANNTQMTLDTQLFIYYDTGVSGLYADANNVSGYDANNKPIYESALPKFIYTVKRQDGSYQMLRTNGLSDNTGVQNTAVKITDAQRLAAAPVINEAEDGATFGADGLAMAYHDYITLKFDKNGAKRTNGTSTVYLLLKRLECINPVVEDQIIVRDLIPSISSTNMLSQIDGIDFSFTIDRGSYELINNRGALQIYAQVEKQNAAGTGYIENTNKILVMTMGDWTQSEMTLNIRELALGTKYRFKLFYKDGETIKEIHNTNFTDPPWYTFTTLGQIDVTNIEAAFNALTYWDKALVLTYNLSSASSIRVEYVVTDGDGNVYSNNDLVNRGIIPDKRILTTAMTESFSCTPGANNVLKPGGTYSLTVNVYPVNASGESNVLLGTATTNFVMPQIQVPAFIVRSIPAVDNSGVHSMRIRITASDNGKSIVTASGSNDPQYAVRVVAPDGTVVLNAPEVFHPINFTQTINITGLEGNTQYTVEIYSVVDTANTGGKTAINLLPKNNVYSAGNLVYSTVQTTLNDYGIKVGDFAALQSGSTKLLLRFANGANLENITMVMYTITCLDDGTSSSGQLIDNNGNLLVQAASGAYYSMMLNKVVLGSGKSYAVSVALYIGKNLAGQATYTIYT